MQSYIGTAGWSIPRTAAGFFQTHGTHLERYASRFSAVEIDSSFYREHMARTYEKWAAVTPKDFRFAVKLSRAFTHSDDWREQDLEHSLDAIQHLGEKLGVILVQLAPRHDFERRREERLIKALRENFTGSIVIEPRHRSWASDAAHQLLQRYEIGKVLADPERCPDPHPDETRIRYRRLHGSPEIYASDYAYPTLQHLAETLHLDSAHGKECWVVFDNTKFGRATHNALELETLEAGLKEQVLV